MPSPLASLTWGTRLAGNNVTVYFAGSGETFDGYTSEGFSAYEQSRFMDAFAVISTYIDMTFTVVASASADFRMVLDTDEINGDFDGMMGPPGESNAGIGIFDGAGSDRGAGGTVERGGYDFMVIIHEVMHSLGLAHPHDTGGSSTIMDGVTSDADVGDFDLNQGVYTVMTYNNGFITGEAGTLPPDNHLFGYEAGPMALDIAVLQSIYGANTTAGSGDTIYDLPNVNASGTLWQSIWDVSGTDTIRSSGPRDVTIDLRAATLLSAVGGGGYLSHVTGIAGGFTIAAGVTIENAIGGAGNDTLIGNGANNSLTGNLGDDTLNGGFGFDDLSGGGGNDMIIGLNGFDTLYGGAGNDDLQGNAGNDSLNGGFGADTLNGGIGADLLDGGGDDDMISGLGGDDTLLGDTGNDTLNGNAGGDTLYGGAGDDQLNGGIAFDILFGDDGNDILSGGSGFDTLYGGAGDDDLQGNAGNDQLDGGPGNDTLNGGAGADIFIFTGGADVILDFANNLDTIRFDAALLTQASPDFDDLRTYADIVGADLVFDFGGGNTLTLDNFTALGVLSNDVEFF